MGHREVRRPKGSGDLELKLPRNVLDLTLPSTYYAGLYDAFYTFYLPLVAIRRIVHICTARPMQPQSAASIDSR